MPIFHESIYDGPDGKPADADADAEADEREGPSQDHERAGSDDRVPLGWTALFSGNNGPTSPLLDRVELIERIKRRESPSWTPTRSPKSPTSRESSRPGSQGSSTSRLLPPLEIRSSRPSSPEETRSNLSAGMEIERPKSALHSGDFRQEKEPIEYSGPTAAPLSTSPVAPWHPAFPPSLRLSKSDLPYPSERSTSYTPTQTRSRAISHASLSNFVFMPPTSPLAQASNSADLDFAALKSRQRDSSGSPERANRRHTFSPQSLQTFRYSPYDGSFGGNTGPRFPYQAHQPRRSLTNSAAFQLSSSPQTPPSFRVLRSPSISSESSPHLLHAPMVGSYEESILRGRMSTTPSRPLNFVAQIGVLGRGACKSSLRCPPHAVVPFPAVFYSYGSGSGSGTSRISDNQPSPYVGLIDLENSLPPASNERDRDEGRIRRHTKMTADNCASDASIKESQSAARRREKLRKRTSNPPSLKAPPGGAYRIPAQGQLQIILKNPNKTAVKLFLVPYDLSDMPVGTKTFIRQRSYSAGPIIDMPLNSRRNLGTDRPEAALSASEDPADRPVLRYLIHLHICCTGKGRYWLYKSIRVVFANRVPDGKEKLRNEVQLPEPRYSTYKPIRDSVSAATPLQASNLAAEKAFRRRSANVSFPPYSQSTGRLSGGWEGSSSWSVAKMDDMDGLSHSPMPYLASPQKAFSFDANRDMPLVKPIPFCLPIVESRPESRDEMDMDLLSRPGSADQDQDDSTSSPTTEYQKLSGFSSRGSSESLIGRGLRAGEKMR